MYLTTVCTAVSLNFVLPPPRRMYMPLFRPRRMYCIVKDSRAKVPWSWEDKELFAVPYKETKDKDRSLVVSLVLAILLSSSIDLSSSIFYQFYLSVLFHVGSIATLSFAIVIAIAMLFQPGRGAACALDKSAYPPFPPSRHFSAAFYLVTSLWRHCGGAI